MDGVSKVFDGYVTSGRYKTMVEGHQYSVNAILNTINMNEPFSFLDVGCGDGWVVRRIAGNPNCIRATGIDKSNLMIRRAKKLQVHPHEEYHVMSINKWESDPFNLIFSMESLYYAKSVPDAISKIHSMLIHNGKFICGTDYYTENTETAHWADTMPITLHMYSESEWVDMFAKSGFSVSYCRVKQPDSPIRWKKEQGTLFIIGVKQ